MSKISSTSESKIGSASDSRNGFAGTKWAQAQFAAQVVGDHDRWTRLIKKAGVTLD